MRGKLLVLAGVLAFGAFVSVALAASVHFKKPAPTFADNGLTATATGSLAGLGNGDIRVVLDATGEAVAGCVNPGTGEHRPAGQQPADVQLTGIFDIPASKVKNGTVSFSVSTAAPEPPENARDAGCPNNLWQAVIDDVVFETAHISVYQDASGQNGIFDAPGTLVLGPVQILP